MATSSSELTYKDAGRRQSVRAEKPPRSAFASVRAIDEAYVARHEQIEALRREGRKVVGYVCNYFPVELVHALGAIPIRLALCSSDAMELGKKYVGESMCPFTRALVGEVTREGSFTHRNVDFLSGAVMCQQAYNALRVLNYLTAKPLRFLWLPLNPGSDEVRSYFLREMEDFARELSQFLGREWTAEALEASVDLYNGIRERIARLYVLQSEHSTPIPWNDFNRVVHAGSFLDPVRYRTLLGEVIDELESHVSRASPHGDPRPGRSQPHAAGPRVILAGSIVAPGDTTLINLLEQAGARVVGDDSCHGSRSFSVPIKSPTLQGLAEAYLESPPCGSAQNPALDSDRRLLHLRNLTRELRADGVVYYCLRFCDSYAFKATETKTYLETRAGVPVLTVHSEYGESDLGQVRTRIEAFVEIIR
jgi:benzoyl-CoA reductase/2-hydroxyglutaryl-CoA dehydratase subunit BcrC/BadD/HgdB